MPEAPRMTRRREDRPQSLSNGFEHPLHATISPSRRPFRPKGSGDLVARRSLEVQAEDLDCARREPPDLTTYRLRQVTALEAFGRIRDPALSHEPKVSPRVTLVGALTPSPQSCRESLEEPRDIDDAPKKP